MFKRWQRRKADNEPQGPMPWLPKNPLPAHVLAWAEAVDVSRMPDRTIREAESYLKSYRFLPLADRQELTWRLMSVIQVHVSPPPPLDAQPLDVFAIVLAARRRELGIG
jgi:hypothetical protein